MTESKKSSFLFMYWRPFDSTFVYIVWQLFHVRRKDLFIVNTVSLISFKTVLLFCFVFGKGSLFMQKKRELWYGISNYNIHPKSWPGCLAIQSLSLANPVYGVEVQCRNWRFASWWYIMDYTLYILNISDIFFWAVFIT